MEIMEYRYNSLKESIVGYEKTGIPLVSFDGTSFKPTGYADDLGLYYFVPKIVDIFEVTLDQAVNIVLFGVIFSSFIIGLLCLFYLFKSKVTRIFALASLSLISFISYKVGGIYIFAPAIAISAVPIFLIVARDENLTKKGLIFILFAGIAIGISNSFRVHSGTPIAIFCLITLLLGARFGRVEKTVSLAVLIVGLLIPAIYLSIILDSRDAFLTKKIPGYQKPIRHNTPWHSIYIGFGFLNNPFGIEYKDQVAISKVNAVSKNVEFASEEYERILKVEVHNLIKEHPYFTFMTLASKVGVVLCFFIIFANIGIPSSFIYRKPLWLDMAFALTIISQSLQGITVMPYHQYLLGFFAMSALFCVVSINDAINNGALGKLTALIEKVNPK